MPPVLLVDQIRCAKRELRLRCSMYPRWVMMEKMSARQAEQEIAAMQAIVKTLEEFAQSSLFGPREEE